MGFERALGVSALLLVLTRITPVAAQPSDDVKEVARGLMAEGRQLRDSNDLQGALSRFQAADAIMGVPTTGYEIARAQADLGMLLEARTTLARVLAIAPRDDDPEPFKVARDKARALDTELTARIGAVRVLVRGAVSGLEVSIDGQVIAPSRLREPVRVNPGNHRIVARWATGQEEREINAPEREIIAVELIVQAKTESPPEKATPRAPPKAAPGGTRPMPTLAYVGGGMAAAGLVVGTVTGLLAINKKEQATAGCEDKRCPPATWDNLDSAQTFAGVSTVSFVVAGVGLGIGTGALVFGRGTAGTAASLRLRARLSGLEIAGSF